MWVVFSLPENEYIYDRDGNTFYFASQRDAELVANVLTEYAYERCEVRELPDNAANAA